jgi:hypothetical protein
VTIDELARQFRGELIAGNREAIARLVISFSNVNRRIDERLAVLLRQMAEAETVSQSWLFEEGRLRRLRSQVEEEINRFAGYAERVINSEQARAVALVGQQSAEIGLINTSFARLPTEALIDLIGNLSDGSHLRRVRERSGRRNPARVDLRYCSWPRPASSCPRHSPASRAQPDAGDDDCTD